MTKSIGSFVPYIIQDSQRTEEKKTEERKTVCKGERMGGKRGVNIEIGLL